MKKQNKTEQNKTVHREQHPKIKYFLGQIGSVKISQMKEERK